MPTTKAEKRPDFAGSVLMEGVIARIREGVLRPGQALPSTQRLAEQYGISYVTAHRALRRLAGEGYCVRRNGRGTYVAERPPTGKLTSVGIPIHLQRNPFHARMIEELSAQAMRLGAQTLLGQAVLEEEFIPRLAEHDVRAVARFPASLNREHEIWRMLTERGIRCVVINDFWFDGGPFPSVRTDEAWGVRQIVEHLIALGHREIVLVDESEKDQRVHALDAYRQTLRRHGIAYDPSRVLVKNDSEGGRVPGLARKVLELGTAALAMYDVLALELMDALTSLGARVGEDFSLAGFDGVREAEARGLTTVVQPVEKLVTEAYAVLQRGPADPPEKLRLRPECVFRESTGALRG